MSAQSAKSPYISIDYHYLILSSAALTNPNLVLDTKSIWVKEVCFSENLKINFSVIIYFLRDMSLFSISEINQGTLLD